MKIKIFLMLTALAVIGCQSVSNISVNELQNNINALDEKVLSGQIAPEAALKSYETLYKRNKTRPEAVGAYADALRRAGEPAEAAELLKPAVKGRKISEIPEPVFMAYSRLILDQGYYKEAEKRLMARLTGSPASSAPQLNNLIGVALAGQNRRAEAEQAFRRALESWDGRPGVVEKNLARLQGK